MLLNATMLRNNVPFGIRLLNKPFSTNCAACSSINPTGYKFFGNETLEECVVIYVCFPDQQKMNEGYGKFEEL